MRKRKHYDWCGSPKAMNERRQTQNCEYNRPKRVGVLREICDWDSHRYYREIDNWKDKRKTQYRENGRGKRHELKLPESNWQQKWGLERYLREHDIPFYIEDLRKRVAREYVVYTERVPSYKIPRYCYKWVTVELPNGGSEYKRVISHQIGFIQTYKEIALDKPRVVHYNRSVSAGCKVVWWSDKNIGIDYILKRKHW